MDAYKRHQKIWRLLYALCHRWICRKFNLTHEDLHVDAPVLLVPNHVCAWDPLLVAMSLRDKQVYYVASEHLFRLGLLSRVIRWMVAPIPRRKASAGIDTAKACLRQLRAGHSVCLFAEGEQCWDGRNIPVFPATGKLSKSSGATLVTYRIEGGYLSLPRWGKGVRCGKVHGHPVGVYPPEVLKDLSAQEVNALIDRDICEDAWERQRPEPVAYRGRRRAEGMEQALYACPGCRRIGTLQTRDDRIFCGCGFSLRYTETGFFAPRTPFASIAEWGRWQRGLLHARDFPHEGTLLFSDDGIELVKISSDHRQTSLGTGTLGQLEDALLWGERRFLLKEIGNMACVQANRLLMSYCGEYYEWRAKAGVSFCKYLEIWEENR